MEMSSPRRLGKTAKALQQLEEKMAAGPVGCSAIMLSPSDSVYFVKGIDGVHAVSPHFRVTGGGVIDALNKLSRLRVATLTVAEKGRAYKVGKNRLSLHVWSKDRTVLDTLKETFGGNYYRHGSGFVWMCSKRSILYDIWVAVRPFAESETLSLLEAEYEILYQLGHEAKVHET